MLFEIKYVSLGFKQMLRKLLFTYENIILGQFDLKIKLQWKIGFLKIHSTKRDKCWSFKSQGWSNHQDQQVHWGKKAAEVGEVSEVAKADKVNEASEFSKAWKSLLRTTEDWVIHVLEFSFISMFWNKIYLGRIMKYHVEF